MNEHPYPFASRPVIVYEHNVRLSLMEFVETVRLPSLREALAVIDGVLVALSTHHDAGLFLPKLAPGNILVEPDPIGILRATGVRLIDPGLPKIANFMSPERDLCKEIDASGDLYDVGCVLYFLLTGRPPFFALTREEALHAHAVLPPPVPSAVRNEVSAAIDRIVARSMATLPAHRFASIADYRASVHAADMALQRSADNTTDVAMAGKKMDAQIVSDA